MKREERKGCFHGHHKTKATAGKRASTFRQQPFVFPSASQPAGAFRRRARGCSSTCVIKGLFPACPEISMWFGGQAYFPGLCWNPSVSGYCGEYMRRCRCMAQSGLAVATGAGAYAASLNQAGGSAPPVPCARGFHPLDSSQGLCGPAPCTRGIAPGPSMRSLLAVSMLVFPHEAWGERNKFSTGTMKT